MYKNEDEIVIKYKSVWNHDLIASWFFHFYSVIFFDFFFLEYFSQYADINMYMGMKFATEYPRIFYS